MRRIQRITSLISSVLLLQLTLLGVGTRSIARHSDHRVAGGSQSESMDSMPAMSSLGAAANHGQAAAAEVPDDCDTSGMQGTCDDSCVLGLCPSMNLCSVAVGIPASVAGILSSQTDVAEP